MPTKETKRAAHVIAQGVVMGDQAHNIFNETQDIKVLQTAIAAYGLATKTALAQVQAKKQTGVPKSIEFFED